MSLGIAPENRLLERSMSTANTISFDISEGMVPYSSLFERFREFKEVQFCMPRGNSPISPMSGRLMDKTMFSLAFQHCIPVNLHIKPSV
ncbi:hypothetical protein KY284_029670 [Solanum tuberosum]|nr:hypothetical protein KY284_029670 [Solanum tuberosum]